MHLYIGIQTSSGKLYTATNHLNVLLSQQIHRLTTYRCHSPCRNLNIIFSRSQSHSTKLVSRLDLTARHLYTVNNHLTTIWTHHNTPTPVS